MSSFVQYTSPEDNMKKHVITAILYTIVTTVVLGLIYPLAITGIAQLMSPDKANGQIIIRDGQAIGSRIIAQPFSGDKYFHPRPSNAGANGYDAANSSASNFGPTNQKLVDRVAVDVAKARQENSSRPVPIDMVTTSGSGLDPDITVANAEFQAPRVASARHLKIDVVTALIAKHIENRQFGILGEPRVNVLALNQEIDNLHN
jgi:K+-transporting ATPase ATPase C chain